MSREAKHTPTPWFIGRSRRGDQELVWVDSCDAPSCGIADLYHRIDAGPEGFYAKPEAEANAALIVKAVNTHDGLVAALERTKRRLAAIIENDKTTYDHHQPRRDGRLPREDGGTIWLTPREIARSEIALIDAALAKAEEKPQVLPPKVEAP